MCDQCAPSFVCAWKVFSLPRSLLQCDISLLGKVSPTDGMVLPIAFWDRHPKCSRRKFMMEEYYRGMRQKIFEARRARFKPHRRCPTKKNSNPNGGCTINVHPPLFVRGKFFLCLDPCFNATSACLGKFLQQTEWYYRKNLGVATLNSHDVSLRWNNEIGGYGKRFLRYKN